jgi:hypothetical protein
VGGLFHSSGVLLSARCRADSSREGRRSVANRRAPPLMNWSGIIDDGTRLRYSQAETDWEIRRQPRSVQI